jgi:hypothetical protein
MKKPLRLVIANSGGDKILDVLNIKEQARRQRLPVGIR